MLRRLSIRNIVLIDALDLEFGAGLGVLTGETGAGKSILLDALGLVLGARADAGLIRAGADAAGVTAEFIFPALPGGLQGALDAADIGCEPGEALILRRQLRREGESVASRGFINDQPVSAALLREIGGYLVELHGQHDDRGFVNARGHRALLDRFAGASAAASTVEAAWKAWGAAQAALEAAREAHTKAGEDRDLYAAECAELAALAPQPGEEAALAAARADRQKGERLAGDLAALQLLWTGSDAPLPALRGAARRLERIAAEHALLGEALAALDRAVIDAGEAEDAINRAAEALAHDPAALDAIETRLFDLRAAARKHACTVDQLAARGEALAALLAAIDDGAAQLADLEAAARAARAEYVARGEQLAALRRAGAARLDAAVAVELAPLRLDAARFQTAITPLPADQWGAGGQERVEFLIATNPGAPFGPLSRIASGGELSRFILALKVALAEEGGAACLIFDEIDRGVGGAVASAIGERLARLAGQGANGAGQLLVVTHSPQVAARGTTHYLIAKNSDGVVTRTSVARLTQAERAEEIARMLSGAEITPEARAQAERLLEGV